MPPWQDCDDSLERRLQDIARESAREMRRIHWFFGSMILGLLLGYSILFYVMWR